MAVVLVTGGAGYVGSHIVWALKDKGHLPIILDNLSNAGPVQHTVSDDTILEQVDIRHYQDVHSVMLKHRVEVVIHCAALTSLPESIKNPQWYYDVNGTGTRTLITACRAIGVNKVVFSSSAAVYGSHDADIGPLSETCVPAPESPYGKTKLIGEWLLNNFAVAYGLDYIALRYFNVAGADAKKRTGQSNKHYNNVMRAVARAILNHQPFTVFGGDYATPDGTAMRDFIHVTDLADAHVRCVEHLLASHDDVHEVLNVGYNQGYSVLNVCDTMMEVTGKRLNLKMAGRRVGDLARVVASNDLIKETLGWAPKLDDLYAMCESTYAWEERLQRMGV